MNTQTTHYKTPKLPEPSKLDLLWTELDAINDQAAHAHQGHSVLPQWMVDEMTRLSDAVRDESMKTGPTAFVYRSGFAGALHVSLVVNFIELAHIKYEFNNIKTIAKELCTLAGCPVFEMTDRQVFSEHPPENVKQLLPAASLALSTNNKAGFLRLLPWLRSYHKTTRGLFAFGSTRDDIMAVAVAKGWIGGPARRARRTSIKHRSGGC